MGQALGVYAALGTKTGRSPRDVPVPDVQDRLLDAGCPLYIMYDVPAGHPLFRPVQELALRGILQDDDPTELAPDESIPAARARTWTNRADGPVSVQQSNGPLQRSNVSSNLRRPLPDENPVSRGAFVEALHAVGPGAGSPKNR